MLERLVDPGDGCCLVGLDKPADSGYQRQADDKDREDRLTRDRVSEDLLGRRNRGITSPAGQVSQCKEDRQKGGDSPEERATQTDDLPVVRLGSHQLYADIVLRSRCHIGGPRRSTLDEGGQIT